jgi:hypothetical protein
LGGTYELSGRDMISKAPRLEPNFHWPLIDALASPTTPLALSEYFFFADIAELTHHSAPTVSSRYITPADEITQVPSGAPVSGLC